MVNLEPARRFSGDRLYTRPTEPPARYKFTGHLMMSSQPKKRWTEGDVFRSLASVFPSPAWVLLPQVRNGTGFLRKTVRTADALAVSVYPSRGIYLSGVEIKVSLSDWRKELANASKSESIQRFCRYWWVAAPEGVVPHGEIPETWGLIECNQRTARATIPAKKLDETPVDLPFMASILRAVSEATVPVDQVQPKIQEAISKARTSAESRVKRKLEDLQWRIEAFEKNSGVKIDEWEAGRIGEAVKEVLQCGTLDAKNRMRQLKMLSEQCATIADRSLSRIETMERLHDETDSC